MDNMGLGVSQTVSSFVVDLTWNLTPSYQQPDAVVTQRILVWILLKLARYTAGACCIATLRSLEHRRSVLEILRGFLILPTRFSCSSMATALLIVSWLGGLEETPFEVAFCPSDPCSAAV